MTERLIDVLDANGQVIHTYPITLDESDGEASIASYEEKALQAAAHGQLVPDLQLPSLTARMHRSHGGRLQPYGDLVSSNSETKLELEQAVRERAYVLWQQEGSPEGGADEYWRRLRDFQAQ